MKVIAGLLLLLFLAITIRFIGNKLVPLVMPTGRLRTIGVGFAGGVAGSLVDRFTWGFGPKVVGVYLVASIVGCFLFILLLGLTPYIKILLGRI
jgi:uncharacterized membrane protein YeaQ/YmgE (transglycosylase-associated protein family)